LDRAALVSLNGLFARLGRCGAGNNLVRPLLLGLRARVILAEDGLDQQRLAAEVVRLTGARETTRQSQQTSAEANA
jgi:hypothetical protein